MKSIFLKKTSCGSIVAFLLNIILVYVIYAVCRCVFFYDNYQIYEPTISQLNRWEALKGSLLFDTSAILYSNMLYAVLMLFPLHYKEHRVWQGVARWVFVVCNALCVIANLVDVVYFKYTAKRTTLSVFDEFSNENNIGSVVGAEMLSHWYLFLIGAVLISLLWICYVSPYRTKERPRYNFKTYYIIHTLAFLLYVPLTVIGMRGGISAATRPITVSNANAYVNHPAEAVLILNTPFSLIRTADKVTFKDPGYFSQQELESIYSPIHNQSTNSQLSKSTQQKKNVVVLIVESFGREYIGAYNKLWGDPDYKSYTPFIDSLYQHCLSFDYTFCNGRKSIDGMPSILSSIPHFLEPFFLTSSSLNEVSGIAEELGKKGYYSAFFHGAINSSMGFQAFARTTGYKDYFGRTEYGEDKRFHGDDDFDGTWAIWDEPFLQFFALKMNEFKQPFVSTVFTATSHQPYVVPEQYKNVYKDEGVVIHKCIRYTDMSLRKFFETAKQSDWYENTIFVITSDHTNLSERPEYQTDLGGFGSPILFFDPTGELQAEQRHCIAQHIDIMPTMLSYLGYDEPYIAFGQDLFSTEDKDTWAVNHYGGIYQFVRGDYVIQFDGQKTVAMYDYKNDWFMKKNLVRDESLKRERDDMERYLKAIIQSYMQRMENNKLTI